MQQSVKNYSNLAELISGWFHQDFDLEGETVEEIISAFNKSCSAEMRQALTSEITHFLELSDAGIGSEFIRIFNPDIEPTEFSPTTRAFLEEILRHL